jgi:hypothetical protein
MKYFKRKNIEHRFCASHIQKLVGAANKGRRKNTFNRKFVTISKDRRYRTKYLPVSNKLIKSLDQSSFSEANSFSASQGSRILWNSKYVAVFIRAR